MANYTQQNEECTRVMSLAIRGQDSRVKIAGYAPHIPAKARRIVSYAVDAARYGSSVLVLHEMGPNEKVKWFRPRSKSLRRCVLAYLTRRLAVNPHAAREILCIGCDAGLPSPMYARDWVAERYYSSFDNQHPLDVNSFLAQIVGAMTLVPPPYHVVVVSERCLYTSGANWSIAEAIKMRAIVECVSVLHRRDCEDDEALKRMASPTESGGTCYHKVHSVSQLTDCYHSMANSFSKLRKRGLLSWCGV